MKRYFRAPWLSVIGDKQHHQCVERFHLQGIHERFARSKALSLRYPPSGQQHRNSVNAQGYTERRYNSIPRYVMFSLAYRFTKKPKK